MREARAIIIASYILLLVGGAFFYVALSYQGARANYFLEQRVRREAALLENQRLRQRAIETQPEDRIPPAPISYPLY